MNSRNEVESFPKTHITVCIPTFRRPELLHRLLHGISAQETAGKFTIDVVVVDNDGDHSAQGVVGSFKSAAGIKVLYCVEPVQNISLTRNRALDNAMGDYIAFIDDDEHPIERWLLTLLNTLKEEEADGVLGPVLPYFESEPPAWLIKGGFCDRPRHETGTVLHGGQTRTGNVLFSADLTRGGKNRFQPEFGQTGGEDIEFFKMLIQQGHRFVWCDEAIVYETVPEARWTRIFYLRKYFRIGGLTGEKARTWPGRYRLLVRSTAALCIYTTALPVSVPLGSHRLMKSLTKVLYHLGWILGFFGFVIHRYRDNVNFGNPGPG